MPGAKPRLTPEQLGGVHRTRARPSPRLHPLELADCRLCIQGDRRRIAELRPEQWHAEIIRRNIQRNIELARSDAEVARVALARAV